MHVDTRQLRADDLADLAPLGAEALRPLVVEIGDLRESLFGDPGATPDLRRAAFVDDRLAAVACGSTRGSDGERGHLKLLVTSPEHRRLGLATRLLDELEDALRARGARSIETGGEAPIYLTPGLPTSAVEASRLLNLRGYSPADTRRSLLVPLRASRRLEVVEASISVRDAGPADLPGLLERVEAELSPEWAVEVAAAASLPGARCLLGLDAGKVAAFACAGVWARNAFGPMATFPEHAGRGLGARLVREALEGLRRRGVAHAVISWIGPQRFYERVLGELEPIDHVVFRKPLLLRTTD